MLPDTVDNTSFKYLKINEKYVQSISIKSLPESIYFLDVVKDLPRTVNYDLSMYISKIDPIKALNDITFNIGVIQSELETINKNQRNIDVVNKSREDTSILRKKIQVENQELYTLSVIITFYSYDINELNKSISAIKSKFYSKGIVSEITNFRHLDYYLSNLPLNIKNKKTLNNVYLTTDGICNVFPFYTNNFYDKGGVILGYTTQNRICCLNIFDKKYENSNMCIFGCSGSGKSFFTKLYIIRNFFLSRVQIVFDIEDEYENLAQSLGGEILFKSSWYNILQITEKELEKENFFKKKVQSVIQFISMCCDIDRDYLEKEIIKLYNKFGINEKRDSVIMTGDGNEIFLDYKIREKDTFPTLYDLLKNMEDVSQRQILKKAIENELKFFSNITSISAGKKLYVLSVKEIIKYPHLLSKILTDLLEEYLGDSETIIYIDEMWKYSKDGKLLEIIFNMYKTIRKRKAAIVTITQDVSDFFEYKNGTYANGILNNANFKVFFKTNYSNLKERLSSLNVDLDKLSMLKKGESIVSIGKSNVKLAIKANDFEGAILNEDDYCSK